MEEEYKKSTERQPGRKVTFGGAEEMKLELRLGLPVEEAWFGVQEEPSVEKPSNTALSLGYFSAMASQTTPQGYKEDDGNGEAKAETHAALSSKRNRTRSTTPAIGWPPVRTFRKNLVSSSTFKLESETKDKSTDLTGAVLENKRKGLFVKINMDGIPIGRKIDLNAYDCYEKLALAVDQHFHGLLAAQREPNFSGEMEKTQEISGLLDGTGEYTLVYEDDEGDKMLVGDVPWEMFVVAAKRLRVLKSSNFPASSLRTSSRKRAANEC